MSKAEEVLRKAKLNVLLGEPFYASLMLRLPFVEDDTPTMATDGKAIYWNREFVSGLTPARCAGVIIHELLHVVFLHHTRRGSRHPRLWNIAADYAINPLIKKSATIQLPDGVLMDQKFTGRSAESIYAQLFGELTAEQGGQMGNTIDEALDKQDRFRGPSFGEVMDAAKPGDGEGLARAERHTREMVLSAAATAAGVGSLPDAVKAAIERLRHPVVDWRAELAAFVDSLASTDFSWVRPNRRYASRGLYLPSFRERRIGSLALVVDVSGSMCPEMVNAISEAVGAAEAAGAEKTIIRLWNTGLVDEFELLPGDELPLDKLKAGGGTDLYGCLEGLDVSAAVILSDLVVLRDGLPPEPGFPVLWAQLGDSPITTPKYGRVIKIN